MAESSCIATSTSNSDTMLPDPLGLLSKTVPSTAITSANVEIWHTIEAQQATLPTKRGVYARFISEEKAEVGKRAALRAEHGMVETILGLHVYILPKSGLGTSGLGSTYEWAWLIGSIREIYFCKMLVEGQSAKYLRLKNIALYGSTYM